jgi:hypothetical protein
LILQLRRQAEQRHKDFVSAAVARATDGVAARKIAALESALAALRAEAFKRVAALEADLASSRREAAALRRELHQWVGCNTTV